MVTIPEVADALQTVLTAAAERLARETGLVRRRRKLGGAPFAQALVFGWLANPEASLEELSQTAAALGTPVSPQALDQRFTPEAAAFLEELLAVAVSTLVAAEPAAIPLLARFTGVYVQDSTTIRLPDALAEQWPGCGGSTAAAGLAGLKLQVRLELRGGQLSGPYPEAGRAQDKASALQHAALPAGALRLADLGYFSLEVLRSLDAGGVYWLSRYQVQTAVFDADGRRWTVAALLAAQGGSLVDLPISLGTEHRLPCRLLAARVPPRMAAERRRKLRAEAQREGQTPSAAKLALCDWTVLVTNAPAEVLSVEEGLVLARARWQIELLFKLWKDHGRVDESRSAKPWRILCEVYAKLLAMVVQHWLLLVGCWAYPDRSLRKAARVIRAHALALAVVAALAEALVTAIETIRRCLAAGSRIQKRKARPATYQRLLGVRRAHPVPTQSPDPLAPAENDRAA